MNATDTTPMQSSSRATAAVLAARYAAEVRDRFGGRLRAVRLYGSVARGEWTDESDIDVLVLLDAVSDADRDWLVRRAFRLGVLENRMLLQPVVMTEDEYAELVRRERRFALDVQREGVAL